MCRIAAGLTVSFTFKTTLKSPPMITAAGTDVEDQDEQEAHQVIYIRLLD